jgi:hypothetical protein
VLLTRSHSELRAQAEKMAHPPLLVDLLGGCTNGAVQETGANGKIASDAPRSTKTTLPEVGTKKDEDVVRTTMAVDPAVLVVDAAQ